MELTFTLEDFYKQRCSLADVLRYWRREGLPDDLCAPLLEDLLVMRFPEFEENLRRQFSFFGRKAETLKDYCDELLKMDHSFYSRRRGKRVSSEN